MMILSAGHTNVGPGLPGARPAEHRSSGCIMKQMSAIFLLGLLASESLAQPGRDSQGDPLPAGALQRLGTARFRAGYTLAMCAFLPDGKSVLTVDQGFTAIVWEVATGKLLHRLDLAERIANPPGLL